MVLHSRAHKEKKKVPFLKAFSRLGRIADAAKAVRVSRDAIHDWRRKDPAFASAFLVAKETSRHQDTLTLTDAVDFFADAIRPVVPECLWSRVYSRIQIAASERKFKVRGLAGSTTPSRNAKVGVPLQNERRATSFGIDSGTLHRSF